MSPAPRTKLSNDIRIANLSSPHPFEFDDGTILEACDDERALSAKVELNETRRPGIGLSSDVRLTPTLTPDLTRMLDVLEEDDTVDLVLCPLMVLEAIDRSNFVYQKCRAIRKVSRLDKRCRHDEFCVFER